MQIAKTQVAGLLKQSKIGPAIDFDVLLLSLVHEYMLGECPLQPWAAPRRITDGRLPALTNLGGAALTRTGITASGAPPLSSLCAPPRTFLSVAPVRLVHQW